MMLQTASIAKILRDTRALLPAVLRVLIAIGVAALTAAAIGLPQVHWAAISAAVVVQGSHGATMRVGRDRMLATGVGAALGALVSAAHLQGWPAFAAWMLALAPAVALGTLRPAFRTAPVAAIIVISSTMSDTPPLAAALLRMSEIAIGALSGVAVSRLLFPSSLHARMQRHAAQLIAALSSLAAEIGHPQGARNEARASSIAASLREIALIARDARYGAESDRACTLALAKSLRGLYEDIAFLARLSAQARSQAPEFTPALEKLSAALCEGLDAARARIVGSDAPVAPLQMDTRVMMPDAEAAHVAELRAALGFGIRSARRQLNAVLAA